MRNSKLRISHDDEITTMSVLRVNKMTREVVKSWKTSVVVEGMLLNSLKTDEGFDASKDQMRLTFFV